MTPVRLIAFAAAALHLALPPLLLVATAEAQPRGGAGILRRKLPGVGGPRRNPAQLKKQINRINRLSPDERKRLLERLPPARREEAERRLKRFNDMSPAEQDNLLRDYNQFQQESPERQRAVRQFWNRFNSFPDDRKSVVRDEVQNLRRLTPEEREERMASAEFREKYDSGERRFLADLSSTFEPEGAAPRDPPEPDPPE